MIFSKAAVDYEIFVGEGTVAVGAVRVVHDDHLIAWIENHGEVRIDAAQVADAHDGKLILDSSTLSPELADAIGRAHAGETRSPNTGVSTD